MPSFDIVSEVNHVEIRNAVDQCNKEITNRFDFKGSDARVELNEKEVFSLTVFADDEFDGSGRLIIHRARQRHRLLAHRATRCVVQKR